MNPIAPKLTKRKVSYLLPDRLVRRINRVAGAKDAWPSEIITAACEAYLKPKKKTVA